MEPGDELDNLISHLLNGDIPKTSKPSIKADIALAVRLIWLMKHGGKMELTRICDEYPEHLYYEDGKVSLQVYAKTLPEVICKAFILYEHGHSGDCHPWTLKPYLKETFHEMIFSGMKRTFNIERS